MKRDKKHHFRFAPLQGTTIRQFIPEYQFNEQSAIIYFRQGIAHTMSDAALLILIDLGGLWKLSRVCFIFPKAIRNWIYKWVARNRYHWFGKSETCRIPSKEEQQYFLH